MHPSIISSALFAALALATPIKRAEVIDIVHVVETITVTAGHIPTPSPQPAPAPVPAPAAAPPPAPAPVKVQAAPAPPAPVKAQPAPAPPAPVKAQSVPAPSPVAQVKAQSAPAAAAAAPASGYQGAVLAAHNGPRSKHGSPALVWSDSLASTAQKIASQCSMSHITNVDGGGYGQNLLFGVSPDSIQSGMMSEFYTNEVGYYPQYGVPTPDMSNFEKWGHFSQVVWKGTDSVGCFTKTDCPPGSILGNALTVCNYGPEGNMGGEYGNNVFPPSS